MPYILSPIITESMPGMWFEGQGYKRENIYSMNDPKGPPVNYDAHLLKPHSLTHMEAQSHTMKDGMSVDDYFKKQINSFFGPVTVVKLKGQNWKPVEGLDGVFHWEVSLSELKEELRDEMPNKLILTVKDMPINESQLHDPNYVLTLSQESADYLLQNPNFNMYGTSWKSSDFNPGSRNRPIHNTLFKQAAIFENLKLHDVPAGKYFFSGFPLPLHLASESPVCPVLFTKEEINF
ncbi:hypothetical protein [Halobacteriovorax sp. ZH4_bin.1]|uniref:hypothetical protein n=1 Tax=unclassified Halobacteriovorax TaxID=2639665 RepID=UPI00371E8F32